MSFGGLRWWLRANKNGVDQIFTSGVAAKVTFGTEVYDRGSCYDTANSRWTPPAGIVHLDAHLWFGGGLTAGGTQNLYVYKNGTGIVDQAVVSSAADGMTIGWDDVANGTDYYELWMQCAGNGGLAGNTLFTFFSGHVVARL